MDLITLINEEVERGFSKRELEEIWDLPKNSLSAIINPKLRAWFSKKAEIRVRAYFNLDPISRPDPSLKIAKKNSLKKAEKLIEVDPSELEKKDRFVLEVENKGNLLPENSVSNWDFSNVAIFQIEDFTEYPKKDCPPNGFEKTEYLEKKKESDDKIRAAYHIYKQPKN